MLDRFWRWLAAEKPDPTPVEVERFGDRDVEAAPGHAVFDEKVERRNLCTSIRSQLALGAEEQVQLVDGLFLRFALYVGDLQASEEHHHAVPYGLFDHSLEVAARVVRRMLGVRVSIHPAVHHREQPRWLYAAVVAALFHDLGKVLDLEVATPDQKDRWDPCTEPLAAFCQRNRLTRTGKEFWSYRKGRGLHGHALNGPKLFPLVLPSQAPAYLRDTLSQISDAMVALTLDQEPPPVEECAIWCARVIHEEDVESSKADRAAEDAKRGQAGAASAVPLAPSPSAVFLNDGVNALVDRALASLGASDVGVIPDPAPATPAAPAAPGPRPPLDLKVVLEDFTRALRTAVEKGWLPVNREGGLYIGRKYVYLHYMDGLIKVMELMTQQGSDLEDRHREAWAAELKKPTHDYIPNPQDWIFDALIAHQRLPGATKDSNHVQQGCIHHPGATGPWWGQVMLLSSMPFQGLPVFEGRMELDGWGDPEKEKPEGSVTPSPQAGALQARPPDEAYSLRVEAELEPQRLLATLTDALRAGVFHRPGGWSPVHIRPDFTWVRVPDAFRILLPRLGIVFSEDLENRILASISRMSGLCPGEDGKILLRIKVHPQSPEAVWAFAIDTRRTFPPETIASLEGWPHPIRVLKEPVPGEYAASPGPKYRSLFEREPLKEELSLELRRLQSFSEFYSKIWDLYARQTEVRKLIMWMNEEFTEKIPTSRLVLYLKRKDSSFEYSALHWAFTIPGLKSAPLGKGGRRKRRLKHIKTPLDDSIIRTGGGLVRRLLFYDFDRRRLAANPAGRIVTKAITRIRQTLTGNGRKSAATAPEAPLPTGGAVQGMGREALETVRLGWGLLSLMLGKEVELLRLTREYAVTPADPRVRLVFTPSGPDGEPAKAQWILSPEEAPVEKLTYKRIRALRVPEAHQKLLSRLERSRREITKALLETDETFRRLCGMPGLVFGVADLGLAAAQHSELDALGRPLEARGEAG